MPENTEKSETETRRNCPAIMQFFKSDHLPGHLGIVSSRFQELAWEMLDMTNEGAEQSAMLRKV